jgi:fucose permease
METPNKSEGKDAGNPLHESHSTASKTLFPFVALSSLFFLWGFITVLVDSLIPRIKELFTLNYFEAGLVQFAFFMAYFILSIPAGFILSKIGYKKGIVLGLLTMALGCFLFYPAAHFRQFGVFLMAYFVLAGGMTILQVAANPYVAVLGDKNKASSRLNLAQAFNSMGTAIAPIIGAMFLLSDTIKDKEAIALLAEVDRDKYLVQEALGSAMVGRTSFSIAHRLSTIRDCSLILVCGDGRVIEQGTHDELMALGGVYTGLQDQQAEVSTPVVGR